MGKFGTLLIDKVILGDGREVSAGAWVPRERTVTINFPEAKSSGSSKNVSLGFTPHLISVVRLRLLQQFAGPGLWSVYASLGFSGQDYAITPRFLVSNTPNPNYEIFGFQTWNLTNTPLVVKFEVEGTGVLDNLTSGQVEILVVYSG